MSEPTIRVESCRADGRCPECGGLYDSTLMHSHDLPCGCVAVGMSCAERHLRALLTEALRSRDTRHKNSPHMLVTKVMWRQVCEERDAARQRAARADALLRDAAAKLSDVLGLWEYRTPSGLTSRPDIEAVLAAIREALPK